MKTEKERTEILEKASAEIQEIASKYGLTIDSSSDSYAVFLTHHDKHDNGDWSTRAVELNVAPF